MRHPHFIPGPGPDPAGRDEDGGRRGRRGGPFGRGGPGGFGPGGPGGRGRGPRGGRPGADVPPADDAAGWFTGRLPSGWFTGVPEVITDRDEITIIGTLPPLEDKAADAAAQAAAESGRIARFREESKAERIEIARQAQFRYGREISWGARVGDTTELFTTASVPVMTRLRQQERIVLDTLVDAGVARSRSEALAWAVRTVGEHAQQWLGDLQDAMEEVNRLRASGPDLG